jgi:class 3 adenylate cyclase
MAQLQGTVRLVWAVAAAKARALGSRDIEPEHLLLGLLEVPDMRDTEKTFLQESLGLLPNEIDGFQDEIRDLTTRLCSVSPSNVATRHALQAILATSSERKSSFSGHRSLACQRVFDQAMNFADRQQAQGVTLCHLMRAILERSSVVLDDLFLSLQTSRERWVQAFEDSDFKILALNDDDIAEAQTIPKDPRHDEVANFQGSLISSGTEEVCTSLDLRSTISLSIPPSSLFRSEELALLMIDLVESTNTAFEKSQAGGSMQGNKLLAKSHRLLHDLFDRYAHNHNPFHVEKPGDAVFSAFRSPVDCCAVACKLLYGLTKVRAKMVERNLPALSARLAIHFAQVLVSIDKPQLFGLPVNLTARLQSLTKDAASSTLVGEFPVVNRLLLTDEMFRVLPAAWQKHVWFLGKFTLKGFGEESISVHVLDWESIIQEGLA